MPIAAEPLGLIFRVLDRVVRVECKTGLTEIHEASVQDTKIHLLERGPEKWTICCVALKNLGKAISKMLNSWDDDIL